MHSRGYKWLVTLPPVGWVALFLLLPYALLLGYSFWTVESQIVVRHWNLENYRQLISQDLYVSVLLRSVETAAVVAALALLLAFPLAYILSFHAGPRKEFLYPLAIIPMWVSYLVRAYAWKTILGKEGVFNALLQFTGIVHEPLNVLLYSRVSVILTLTHIYTPFVLLPIYASLEHIPRALREASDDLGASTFYTFRRLIVPLSLPGVVAGVTFAFVLSLGDFIAPLLLGGPSGIMIANVVSSLFGAAYNWPLGAAVSVVMLLLIVGLLSVSERVSRRLESRT